MKFLTFTRSVMICFAILITASHAHGQDQSRLLNYTYLGKFSQEQAKSALKNLPALNTLQIKYDLDLYKVLYRTPAPDGTMVSASGLVAMPVAPSGKVGIVSYQHGTRVTRTDVPSENNVRNYMYIATFGSSGGYMVSMPDYLGLGDSSLALHPYVQADTLAESSVDMLVAAKELAAKLHYPLNDKLFLTGYSEGGFSTTVMYEDLLNYHPDLPVTAAAPGSAPYDWQECMRFVILDPGPRATAYIAYFFYSMQTYHHYWSSMSEIFRAPYDTLIPTLYDGTHQIPEILEALPKDPRLILNEAFLQGILSGTDRHNHALERNFNHYTFTAAAPFLMVGTKGDHDVPYHGAELAYEVLKKKSSNVYIKSVSDTLDHLQANPLVAKEQLEFFKQYDR